MLKIAYTATDDSIGAFPNLLGKLMCQRAGGPIFSLRA
jgi:hypothetical protein